MGFTHLFFPASHRRVPSVSFVCLSNFHKTPSLLHKNILRFTDLCTSTSGNPLLIISLCTPGTDTRAWRTNGTRMVLLSTAELTKLHRSCVWNNVFYTLQNFLLQRLDTMQEFLGTKRVWGGTLIWTLRCSSGCNIYLMERVLHLGGGCCAASLLGVKILSLINKQDT